MRPLFVSATISLIFLAMCTEAPLGARARESAAHGQAQPPHWETFEGILHGCSSTNPDEMRLTPGDTLHFKGGSNVNLWMTDHPLVSGLERNIVDANINFNAGVGRAHAVATLTPEGIAGWWDLRFLVRIGGGASGVGMGRGTLEGLRIEFTVEHLPEPQPNQCTPGNGFVRRVSGTVRGEE